MNPNEALQETLFYLQKRPNELDTKDIFRIQELIRFHNERYYLQNAPIIDDGQWDTLFSLLKKGEEILGIFDPLSPTKRIDVLLSQQFSKGLHLDPMISLDNTYNKEDIIEFQKRARNILKLPQEKLESILELKFDGLGISILYEDGSFVRALTRGNGIEGEDISINALEIHGVPKTIPWTKTIEIRGEVIMPHKAFEATNELRKQSGEKIFANPRNAASGSLRQLDPLITRERKLEFYAYSVPRIETFQENSPVKTYSECRKKLEEWGFQVSPFYMEFESVEKLGEYIESIEKKRPSFDFDIDGLVIKLQSFELWRLLGNTEHHPRSAIAYKFPQIQVQTKLIHVEHSVGRTGTVTPVAHLEPVQVTGVTVSRATLHNYQELARKDVRIGDRIYLQRAGEVIPEILGPNKDLRTGDEISVIPPEKCPSCGSSLAQDIGKVALYCPNSKHCPAQTLGSLEMFVSKHALNIDGMGEKILELFVEKGFIDDIVSIFSLQKFEKEIENLEGFEKKKTQNLLNAVEKARKVELARLFVGLGIPEIGRKTAKTLAFYLAQKKQILGEDVTLSSLLGSLTQEELIELPDIGEVGALSLLDYWEDHKDLISHLEKEISLQYPVLPSESGEKAQQLSGKSFCVTGSFDDFSRDEIHERIEIAGGEVRTGVTSKLDYLIVGKDAGSKSQKAKELGISCISLAEFLELLQK